MKRLMISGFGRPRDPWLEFPGPDIRFITLHDVLEATRSPQIAAWGQSAALDYDLGLPAQIIASTNDPYTSLESLRRIQDDFMIPDFYAVKYGHFPYAARGREAVQDLIHNFEATPRAVHAKRKK